MALSRGRINLNSRVVQIASSLAIILSAVGLGWAALYFSFGPNVRYVDPAVFPELSAIGQVVGEEAGLAHEWENYYVELKYLVVYLDGSVKEDILAEAEQRLNRSGWRVWTRDSQEIGLESARWTNVSVRVEPFEGAGYRGSKLREAAAAAGLPMNKMVYVTVLG